MTADFIRHPREGGDPDTLSPAAIVSWIPAYAGMTGREHSARMTRFALTLEFEGPAGQCGGAGYDPRMTVTSARHPRDGGGPDTLSPACKVSWIPASAGMTGMGTMGHR